MIAKTPAQMARSLAALALAVTSLAAFSVVESRADTEGVAVAIVYDTSGSMLQKVRDAKGQMTPKNVIAERALRDVIARLERVASGPVASRTPLDAGLVIFEGDQATLAVEMGRFVPEKFRAWLRKAQFQSGTPLGSAVQVAGDAVLASKQPRKHVLVITDGINTKGPEPTVTLPRIQQQASKQGARLSYHFIAFDVNARVFDGLKKQGATVVAAADEKQLNTQLEFVLEKKILLEDEEPPSKVQSN